jgi:hypothetical protein
LKRPAIAAVLSLLLPGLGHVYAGALGAAVVFLLLDAAGSAALELGAGMGAAGITALVIGKPLLKVLLRGAALAHSAIRAQGEAPAGAYAFFVIASILLPFALGSVTGRYVTVVPLSEGGGGFEANERIVAKRFGAAATPRVGEPALYFCDWPDAGPGFLTPTLRQARVGRVEALGDSSFTVGSQALPLSDYGGQPVGVMLSPSDAGMRWDRLGAVGIR